MFHLEKICRICVRGGGTLHQLHGDDIDFVKFSDKLHFCTKMVVGCEDMICSSCIRKLRISYVFQRMCSRSETVLQGYVAELTGRSGTEKFLNSDLRVTLIPLPQIRVKKELSTLNSYVNNNNNNITSDAEKIHRNHQETISDCRHANRKKRKRVSKGQRCSLLKKLLTGPKSSDVNSKASVKKCGGLKDLLYFIKDYDFGYKLKNVPANPERTPLDKLETFSRTFFYTDFTDYRNTILSVIHEGYAECSDDDEMFNSFDEDEDDRLWNRKDNLPTDVFEEVVIEPDIKIKLEFEPDNEREYLPSELVQTCYEPQHLRCQSDGFVANPEKEFVDFETYLDRRTNGQERVQEKEASAAATSTAVSSLELLEQFTTRARLHRKTISPNSLKCRTRGQPFINPHLMEQFKQRNFRCDTCNRSFKSPGYLHSHCTKMGH